jgi:hypothetical protein
MFLSADLDIVTHEEHAPVHDSYDDTADHDADDEEDEENDQEEDISVGRHLSDDEENDQEDVQDDNPLDTSNVTFEHVANFLQQHDKYSSFSIVSDIDNLLVNSLLQDEMDYHGKSASKVMKCDGTETDLTTVTKTIHNALVQEKVNIKSRNKIVKAIREALNCPLPLYSYNEHQSGSAGAFVYQKSSVLKYPVCRNGDHVFVGNYANEMRCDNTRCRQLRVRRCTRPACKGLAASDICEHGFQYRSCFRWIQYRPISLYIQKALKYHSFPQLITTEFPEDPFGNDWDLMHKDVAKDQINAMKNIWEQQSDEVKSTCQPINLLFGISYDGVKVYSKKTSDFNPLFVCILNMPPFLRSKKGVGMFPVSIFDGIVGQDCSDSEDFLFSKCLVDELLELEKGKIIETIDHQGKRVSFFVQGRVILHSYDTRAFESIMHIFSTNSYNWCFLCTGVKGSRKKQVGTVCYLGNRGYLELESVLRLRGQSMSCCPRGFYGEHASHGIYGTSAKPNDINGRRARKLFADNPVPLVVSTKEEVKHVNPCCVGSSHEENVADAILNKPSGWLHTDIIDTRVMGRTIGTHLYYDHLDLRPVIKYERTSNESYYVRGMQAITRKKKTETNSRGNSSEEPTDDRTGNNGVKGIYFFAKLSYADIRLHMCWDPFHCFMNISLHVIQLLKNQRANSKTVTTYCSKSNLHPSLWHHLVTGDEEGGKEKSNVSTAPHSSSSNPNAPSSGSRKRKKPEESNLPAWVISKGVQTLVDNVIASILVPAGCKSDFQISDPFGCTGHLNGMAKIKVITVLMDLINLIIFASDDNYPTSYLYFFKILSVDMTKLMCRGFSEEASTSIAARVVETVALYEGLFPPSEALHTTHQLIDVAAHIKVFGPVSGWWTLNCERAVGDTADKNTKGGSLNYITAFRREYQECDVLLHETLNTDIEEVLKETNSNASNKGNTDFHDKARQCLSKDDTTSKLSFLQTNTFVQIKDKIKACPRLALSENKALLKVFMDEIKTREINCAGNQLKLDALCGQSIFFRFLLFFRHSQNKKSDLYNLFWSKLTGEEKGKLRNDINECFAVWLQQLRSNIKALVQNQAVHINQLITGDENTRNAYRMLFTTGKLRLEDYNFLKSHHNSISQLNFGSMCSFYDRVSHNGVKLQGRYDQANGHEGEGNGRSGMSRLEERLKSPNGTWNSPRQLSSWCIIGNDIDDPEDKRVGQISLFLKFNLAEDQVINSQVWVHCLVKQTTRPLSQTFINRLQFVPSTVTVKGGQFMCMQQIFASPIAVLPMNISVSTSTDKKTFNIDIKVFAQSLSAIPHRQGINFFETDPEQIKQLCLFPLEPHNMCL